MKNKKILYGIISLVLLFVCVIVIAAGIVRTQKASQGKGYNLIIPSREEILENGYPVNEDGLLGDIYAEPKISSPEEAVAYMESIDAAGGYIVPMYLQDGKTVIGEYRFEIPQSEVYTNAE